VGADTQCEREDSGAGKQWVPSQLARGIAHIAPEDFDPRDSLHVSSVLLQSGGVAELPARGEFGLIGGHSLTLVALRQQAQVRANFIAELAIRLATHQSCEAGHPKPEPRDHFWPSRLNTRPITPEMRFQFSVSRANCFCPFFVME